MGHFCIIVTAIVLTLFGQSQAACSPCPFQWREHQHHCYKYFPWPLQHGQAEKYCRHQHARRHAGGLVALDSVEEMLFIMDYVGRVITGPSNSSIHEYVWLGKVDKTYDNYSMIYSNALNAADESDHFFRSCHTLSSATPVSLSEIGTGTYGMIPAPELVEQRCAVYAGEGAYLDLGDFAGTCLSDPDVCTSEALTWSVWIKINSEVPFNAASYFFCSGGFTYRARGVGFWYVQSLDMFRVAGRSLRKSWSFYNQYSRSRIPMDTWFHLASTVDLTQTNAQLRVYLNGVLFNEDSTKSETISTNDSCTDLVLGSLSPCPDLAQTPSTKGGSAAYSNLMAFDHLLTPMQIANIYACGSLDWGLKVRSLHLDANPSYSGSLRYVCKASASSGPTIYWKVYHADQAQWEDLGQSSGPGVDITPTSLSTCVVQSVLVIDRSLGPSSAGDIISCTASSISMNASIYINVIGNEVSVAYNDHDNAGYLFFPGGEQYYRGDVAVDENSTMIYSNALNAANESDHYLISCHALSPATAVSLSEIGTGTYGMVPAPELVEQRCAVYAGEGAYLDLGDFAGTCLSDPDVCTSEALTWSVWIKINSEVPLNWESYFFCSGGFTYRGRGVGFWYKQSLDMFRVAGRSLRKTWSFYNQYSRSRIPMDTWFHLASTVDLTQTNAQLRVYLNGVLFNEDSTMSETISTNDRCTDLVLGSFSPCSDEAQLSSVRGGSAAYSNLMAFDQLLTPMQIANIYACGSLDWGLKVRSLHLDANSSYSGNLRYVCKASASSGPTIYWKVYHADQAQWQDLGLFSMMGVDITLKSLSTCVSQSVLVIDRSRASSSAGDIISCTASSNSLKASLYINVDENKTQVAYSDHGNAGYPFFPRGEQYYKTDFAVDSEGPFGNPFICEKEKLD